MELSLSCSMGLRGTSSANPQDRPPKEGTAHSGPEGPSDLPRVTQQWAAEIRGSPGCLTTGRRGL